MDLARRLALVPCLMLFGAAALAGNTIDLNLNDETVRAAYITEFEDRGFETDVSYLRGENDGQVAAIGLHVVDFTRRGSNRFRVGLGGKLFYFDKDGTDGASVGIGGFVTLLWPGQDRLELSGSVYYSPDVLSFGDADEYLDTGARFGYRVFDRAEVYVGVRSVRAEFGDSDKTIDSGVHAGLRISF